MILNHNDLLDDWNQTDMVGVDIIAALVPGKVNAIQYYNIYIYVKCGASYFI